MSFFLDEPPPLDYEIPPPLDDKIRDNDFDLEDEIIIEDNISTTCLELPDLPSDFNVYSAASFADEDNEPPPDVPSFQNSRTSPSSSTQGDDEKETIVDCDVAKKKESDRKKSDDDSTAVNVDVVRVLNESTVEDDVKTESVECDEIGERTEPEGSSEVNELTVTKVNEELHLNDKEEMLNEWDVRRKDSKTENSEDDFDDFTEFQADIPIQVPELNRSNDDNDDDDDEFNDFESAIPSNRQVEMVQQFDAKVTLNEVAFEADFSGFNAFSDESKDDFDDFQDFSSAQPEAKTVVQNTMSQLAANDDDDDFGDFSDFTAAQPSTDFYPSHSKFLMKPDNVNETFNMMFPTEPHDEVSSSHERPNSTELSILKSDNFVSKFNDFDTTVALRYQYNNSNASQTLVKSLGIDTRNILAQWNSSSSNVPRFAANLSFSPIEPIKPSEGGQKLSSENLSTAVLQPSKAETVPEADFDWNTSGLVNPLDGAPSKESTILQEESLQPSSHPFEDESTNSVVDKEVKQTFEAETKAHASHKSELSEPYNYQWSNNSNLVRTIKLPETHIFTPVKGTSPVSREVVSRDLSPPLPTPSDDPLPPKSIIFVKEYHDVEYSLEPIKKTSDVDNEFDDFQSADTVPPIVQITEQPALMPILLEPIKPADKSEIKWPEPGVISNQLADDDFAFLEIGTNQPKIANPPVLDEKVTNLAFSVNPSILSNSMKTESFIGVETATAAAVKGDDDDAEFDDFQSAEPITPKAVEVMKPQDPITLSPAHLVAQTAQQPSTWISSFDDAEVSRIEAAFPKCKVNKSASSQHVDDDNDWSDFVTATPQNPSKLANGDNDDWSDFVSMPPVARNSSPAKNSISSQVQSKPNFTSWSQPMRNQFVNHSTSFLTNNTKKNSNYQFPFISDNVPRQQAITITDNFNYFQSQNQINHQQPKKSNGVSTILPELDFAMPKQNVVNFSRGGHLDPGKK